MQKFHWLKKSTAIQKYFIFSFDNKTFSYYLLFLGLLSMKTYHSIFLFHPCYPLCLNRFIIMCMDILCICVPLCVYVCTPVLMRHCIIIVVQWFNKKMKWYPELRHQTPEASWVMVHRSTARTKRTLVKGMEIVEKRDRWSRQKTSSPGSAVNSVWGLKFWGLCQSRSARKVAPLRKRE